MEYTVREWSHFLPKKMYINKMNEIYDFLQNKKHIINLHPELYENLEPYG